MTTNKTRSKAHAACAKNILHPGNVVYVVHRRTFEGTPMKVATIDAERRQWAVCEHPELGRMFFGASELIRSTPRTKERLKRLAKLTAECNRIVDELHAEGYRFK